MRYGIARLTPPDPRARSKEDHDPEWHLRLLEAVPGLVLIRHAPPLEWLKPFLAIVVECTPEAELTIRRHLGEAFTVGVDEENYPLLMEHIRSTGLTVDEYYAQQSS